jgi:cytochrome c oxidase assembly protein subunit 11
VDRSIRTAVLASGVAASMAGLGYASVPLYRLFCEATGLNGTTRRVTGDAPGVSLSQHKIDIRFDANHVPEIPWEFKPAQNVEQITVGARDIAFYTAKNLSNRPITGRATYNVTPIQAGKYFNKISCFCFTLQTLQPGKEVRMPVVFYVDPKIADDPDARDIQEITLSYTFYPVDDDKKPS